MGTTSRTLLAAAAVLLVAGLGCGRKAPPIPPQVRVAAQTRDLAVEQRTGTAVLTWSYPAVTSAGGPLPDVEAIEVWRAVLPPGQEPTGTSPRDLQVKVQLLESQGELLTTLDVDGIAAATRGSQLVFEDDLAAAIPPGTAPVVWYAVRTVCCNGRESDYSTIARLLPGQPPEPPADLEASGSREGIALRWSPPVEVTTLVERSDGDRWQALTPEPISDAEWLDTGAAQGRTWRYRLRGVITTQDGTRLIGEPGPEVTVEHPDVYPPAAPANLVCLPEEAVVRVRWTGAGDDVRFRVERRRQGGPAEVLASDHPGPEFVDSAPPAGALTYSVVAVDSAGNASQQVGCDTIIGSEP